MVNNFKDYCASITRMQNKELKEKKIKEIKEDERLSFLISNYKNPELIQFLWHLYNNIFEVQRCEFCGEPLRVITKSLLKQEDNIIYMKTCGNRTCVTENRKQTNINRYGVDNPMKVLEIKEKYKNHFIDKYGVDNPLKYSLFKDKLFDTNIKKYGNKCSLRCDQNIIKSKKTSMEKYGVDNPLKCKQIILKVKQTNLLRYGVEFPMQNNIIKQKAISSMLVKYGVKTPIENYIIKEKIKNTNLIRYGTMFPAQNDDVLENTKNTNLKRYGVTCTLHLKNSKESLYEYHYENNKILFAQQGYGFNYTKDNKISVICPKCNKEVIEESHFLQQRRRNGWEICTHCNPITSGTSLSQKEFESFFINHTPQYSNRKILDGKEIDIFVPSLNIGFEFNGVYWHSDKFKSKYYHQEKKILAADKGVNLIHIWEDDWSLKKSIIEARIKNVLGVTENKIFARKCTIVEVSASDSKTFLEQNHIQGQIGAKHRLGLSYEGNLVSLMTFGNRNGKMEMLRFCNKLNFNIVGGFSRLLKHFRKEFSGEIYSYADLDWSNPKDNVYLRNGFTFVKKTEPGYFWVKNDRRYSRQQFQKHKLVAQGFDASKTEDQIMIERGYLKIYNSGNLLYVI